MKNIILSQEQIQILHDMIEKEKEISLGYADKPDNDTIIYAKKLDEIKKQINN